MTDPIFPVSSLDFMRMLADNNNREWFTLNKAAYQQELAKVEVFTDALLAHLNAHDVIETPSGKKSLHRIYRDIRFSKNKTPYKANWSGYFRRASKHRRGGYYFHIEPGNTYIAGGFWSPNPGDLKRIREDIAFDAGPLRKILSSASFTATFGTLIGEQLKTEPYGFNKDHEAIDLLRYKQFLLIKHFTDKEVLHETFVQKAGETYIAMRPFFDYMSEVLTTDINGIYV
jgi:uncharacterized protein (TIGR02453 family)